MLEGFQEGLLYNLFLSQKGREEAGDFLIQTPHVIFQTLTFFLSNTQSTFNDISDKTHQLATTSTENLPRNKNQRFSDADEKIQPSIWTLGKKQRIYYKNIKERHGQAHLSTN